MKYLKLFEEYSIIQQPFFLIGDTLFISDEIAHRMTPKKEDYIRSDNPKWAEYMNQQNMDFFAGTRDEKGYLKSNRIGTKISVGWGTMYKMDLSIHRANARDNEFGHFEYYVGGISGTHEMHGKNMVRATRECNLNLMEKLYPIVGNIKNFNKRLKNKEAFFDIIREEILKNPGIAKDGVPPELEEELGYTYAAVKYNL
jgi:hypothetical protein